MSLDHWNIRDHGLRILVLVIVFMTITSKGSPRKYKLRNDRYRQDRSISRSFGLTTSPKLHFDPERSDDDVLMERNGLFNGAKLRDVKIGNDEEEDRPSFLDDFTDLSRRREINNNASCVEIILKRYPGICEIVIEIKNIQRMMPNIRNIAERRMGLTRRFDFSVIIWQSKLVLTLVYEAVRCLAVCLKKFINLLGGLEIFFPTSLPFLGTSLPLSGHSITTHSTTTHSTPSLINIMDTPSMNHSNPWWSRRDIDSQDEANSKEIDEKPSDDQIDRVIDRISMNRGFDTDFCSVNIASPDACVTLMKIDEIQRILMSRRHSSDENDNFELPVKISSKDLDLNDFIDAILLSLTKGQNFKDNLRNVFPGKDEKMADVQGRRHLLNERDEDVTAIFETPDFRIEFVAENDEYSNLNGASGEGNEEDFSHDHRFFDRDRKNRKLSRKGLRRLMNEMFYSKFSRSLNNRQKIIPRRHRVKEDKSFEGSPNWLGPFYASDIIPTGKLDRSRSMDPRIDEKPIDERNLNMTTITLTKENDADAWRNWINEKFGDFFYPQYEMLTNNE